MAWRAERAQVGDSARVFDDRAREKRQCLLRGATRRCQRGACLAITAMRRTEKARAHHMRALAPQRRLRQHLSSQCPQPLQLPVHLVRRLPLAPLLQLRRLCPSFRRRHLPFLHMAPLRKGAMFWETPLAMAAATTTTFSRHSRQSQSSLRLQCRWHQWRANRNAPRWRNRRVSSMRRSPWPRPEIPRQKAPQQ